MLPFLAGIKKWTGKLKDNSGIRFEPWPVFVLGAAIFVMSFIFMPNGVSFALSLALFLAPVWLPFLLIGGAWKLWVTWRRSEFIADQKTVLLEIKPPRNLVKTPLAMEAFLSSLHQTGGESNWYMKWIKGSVRMWFSLEMASFGGKVHFYIWTRIGFRPVVEAQLYSQYPEIQIIEVPDYTRTIGPNAEEGWGVWGCDFKHTEKDPLPIKTYVEYGLDKVQKEPEQVDPLASLIEYLGSIGKDEYIWLQIVIRAHKGEKYHQVVKIKGKPSRAYTWKDQARELVEEMRKATRTPYIDPTTGKEMPGFPNPTKGESEKMAAIERNTSKFAFDVGIRSVYLVKPGSKFNVPFVLHMLTLFNPFHSEGWNGLKSAAWMKSFDDYPWEELWVTKKKNEYRHKMIEAYQRRQFFYEPFSFGISHDDIMVMSTEELATIFHIPSQAVTTPTLERIQSATSEAPSNLPV